MCQIKKMEELTMNIRIDLFVHHNDERESQKLDAIINMLKAIQRKEENLMKEVDDMIAIVAATKGIAESTDVAVTQTLAYEKSILDQIANTTDPAVIADLNLQLMTYNAALSASKDKLLAAIPVNAPATPAA
jgi:hypothetical protein